MSLGTHWRPADFGGKHGSVEWIVDISSTKSRYELSFRYATSRTRPTKLLIDGREQSSLLNFPSKSSWDTWKTMTYLPMGAHSIKLSTSNVSEGPNIDWMSLKLVSKGNEYSASTWMNDESDHGQRSLRGVSAAASQQRTVQLRRIPSH